MACAFLADGGALRAGEDVLGGLEGFGFDDRGVRLLFGPEPFVGWFQRIFDS